MPPNLTGADLARHSLDAEFAEVLAEVATQATRQALVRNPLGRELVRALCDRGWQPPSLRASAGRKSGETRAVGKLFRRGAIRVIMDGLPATYRNAPRSNATIVRVQAELKQMAPHYFTLSKFLIVSDDTVQRDIFQLGYRHGGRLPP